MVMEKQSSWGVPVALYMFFGGMGAGIFLSSFLLGYLDYLRWPVMTGILLGPVLVLCGLGCLLLKAGAPSRSFRVFMNIRVSGMSRGWLVQSLFVLVGLVYALPGFWFPGWFYSGPGIGLGGVASILALAVGIYHGRVLSENRAIPLWSSSVMPLLSLFTALCTGAGLWLLIAPLYSPVYGSDDIAGAAKIIGIMAVAFIAGGLIGLWSLAAAHSDDTFRESMKRIKRPVISGGICLLTGALPLIIMITAGGIHFTWASTVSGLLMLGGGFVIRYSIIEGGYYLPLRIAVPGSC